MPNSEQVNMSVLALPCALPLTARQSDTWRIRGCRLRCFALTAQLRSSGISDTPTQHAVVLYSTPPPEHCSPMHACMRPARKNRSRRDASVDGMDRQATSWRVAFRSFDNQTPSRPYVGVCRGGLLAAAGVQAEHDLQGQARPCPSVWCSLLAPSPSTTDHCSCAEMRGVAWRV